MIISIVLCLISKLFLGLDKLGAKRLDKNINFCPHWITRQLFILRTSCLKYQNNPLFAKHCTNTKLNLSNTLNFVLCYSILYFYIWYLYFADQNYILLPFSTSKLVVSIFNFTSLSLRFALFLIHLFLIIWNNKI
jgi:hypothetical protein